jgi:hypothetical protein
MPDDPGEADDKGQGRVERLPEIHDESSGKYFPLLSVHHIEAWYLSGEKAGRRGFFTRCAGRGDRHSAP